jgi:hypothetical protein
MSLKYNILWFEDNDTWYTLHYKDIEQYLKDLGYIPVIDRRDDDTNLIKEMEERNTDLLLVDYNLNIELKGDQLVRTVRHNDLYTEAIFYAQNPQDLEKIQGRFEGVFYTKRENLIDKTKKVIDLTIKKNQDVENTRGLFIAQTIYIVEIMEEIISKILKLSGEESDFFQDQIIQEMFFEDSQKHRIIQNYLKHNVTLLQTQTNPSKLSNEERKTLLEEINKVLTDSKDFVDEVIYIRNDLAHAKLHPTKKNVLKIRNKKNRNFEEKCFDLTECKKMRDSFLKHTNNYLKILELISKLN